MLIWNPWKENKRLRHAACIWSDTVDRWQSAFYKLSNQLADHKGYVKQYERVLQDIAAEEKPTSNATVKRMARMAREALNK